MLEGLILAITMCLALLNQKTDGSDTDGDKSRIGGRGTSELTETVLSGSDTSMENWAREARV